MIRLAVDTAFEQLSMALIENNTTLARYHSADRRRNASILFQKLDELMVHAGIKPNAIDNFVINQGPDSLRLLASQVCSEKEPFLVLLNCTREELFVAEFQYQQEILKQLSPITLKHLEELKKDLTSKPILLHRIQRTNDRWASSFEGINCMKLDRPEVDAVLLDLAAMEGIRHQILECTPSAQPLYIKRDV
ncbi:MAG: hypothetical protein EBT88_14135 [Proteobacteria bacterium]|nr:hypothetical protein [Pseudomonadota bacterium]